MSEGCVVARVDLAMVSEVMRDLDGLIEQATKERSHYYVANTARRAQAVIAGLTAEVAQGRLA